MNRKYVKIMLVGSNGAEQRFYAEPESAAALKLAVNAYGVRPNATYSFDTPVLDDGAVATYYFTNAVIIGFVNPPLCEFGDGLDLTGKNVHETEGNA